jgi:hypothetical protein
VIPEVFQRAFTEFDRGRVWTVVQPVFLGVVSVAQEAVFVFRERLFALDPIAPMPTFIHDQTDLGGAPLVRREAKFKHLRRELK